MNVEKITKWIAYIAILAGVVRLFMTPMALIFGQDSPEEMWPGFTACVLMTIGAIGLYLAQAEKIGVLGFISFMLLTVGNILVTLGAYMTLAGFQPKPDLIIINILMMACLTLGSILFSIVTFRAKVLPRAGAVFMILFVLMMFSPAGIYLPLAWGLSYIILGYGVLKQPSQLPVSKTALNV
ncbi:hypothetical protein ACFSCX_00420 [Bacillus salitolerans]|uniref:Uncharacterized protein n=1 Tax=Bacillus salitolerans TaxID=1437434 RepID=A0ABW4LIU3_9BACI